MIEAPDRAEHGHPSRRRVRLVVALGVVLLTGACASDRAQSPHPARDPSGGSTAIARPAGAALPTAVQQVDIVGTEYTFTITPDPVRGLHPGWTEVRFHNRGGEAHQVMFARLKDGVDLSKLAAAAGDSSGAAAIEFVDMLGGVSYIGPGKDITAMVDLPAGTVLAMCYVPDRRGVAHALMGMTTTLNVAPATPSKTAADGEPGASGAPDARVRGTIELAHSGYEIPRPLRRGWYHVVNTDVGKAGTGLHELALMRLGHSIDRRALRRVLDDIATNATPEVRLDALGGLGAISPGFDGYLFLDLPRGDYLAVDFMPDARAPRPHLLDGYATTFGV